MKRILEQLFYLAATVFAAVAVAVIYSKVVVFFQDKPELETASMVMQDSATEVTKKTGGKTAPVYDPTVRKITPMPPEKKVADEIDKLDHEFKQFLAERGESMEGLADMTSSAPLQRNVKATGDWELPEEATEQLMEDYYISDARGKANGEIWIKLDQAEADNLSMEELSAKAAELYGDGVTPLKIVVWVGNRPQVVQTFNGPPLF